MLIVCSRAYAFDHEYKNYSDVLSKHVRNGLVDYASLQKDRSGIDLFVKEIGMVTNQEYLAWSRDQQLAYWINAYNGWFLQIVIDRYPIQGGRLVGVFYPQNSVQRIPGIWDKIKTQAAGQLVSLNDIEHKMLRRLFNEPRIHFSIVCASIGCPLLRSEPFRATSLQSRLDQAARDFMNNPAKVHWNESNKQLELSKIFDWFTDDFDSAADDQWRKSYSKKQAGSVAFASRYLPDKVAQTLKSTRAKIVYLDYDWTLNETAKTPNSPSTPGKRY